MSERKLEANSITINGREIPTEMRLVPQIDINFYNDNPRIYSEFDKAKQEASQADIEEIMVKLDHVYKLAQSIKANKGIVNPLVVREADMVVLEGNSRLAAYRLLARNDGINWGLIKCRLIIGELSEEEIFSLLGQTHIIGVKEWSPYEQAGYLWRRVHNNGAKPKDIAKELGGLTPGQVEHMVKVYDFMMQHKDLNPQDWSHYDVYLKSAPINKKRNTNPELDNAVVKKIVNHEITRATDIRDKLKTICMVDGDEGKRLIAKFVKEPNSLESCYEVAQAKGEINALLIELKSFRAKMSSMQTRMVVKRIPQTKRNEFNYEFEQARDVINKLLIVNKEQ